MANANRLFLWLLGAVLLGGVLWYGYWFAMNFERQSKEVRTDISPEARKNRFLAAELFLRRSGQTVQSLAGRDIFSVGPAPADTLFLGGRSRLFLQRNHDKLLEWVTAGGHLILVPEAASGDEQERFALLQKLGVELHYADEEDSAGAGIGTGGDEAGQCGPATNSEADADTVQPDAGSETEAQTEREKRGTVVFHTGQPGEFKASFLADRYLSDTGGRAEVAIGDSGGRANLLRYTLGSGTVTVLSDMGLFTNDAIGEDDHAYLLSVLADTPGKVWIFYSAAMPSLLVLLWQHAPYVSAVSFALLLMAAWMMWLGSGPRLKPRYDQRRNLLEHLDASAEYSWRIDRARQLYADNRTTVEKVWRRRHPQLNTLDQAQRCEWIGEKTGIAPRAVERALYGEIDKEHDFIRATSVLQQLAMKCRQRESS